MASWWDNLLGTAKDVGGSFQDFMGSGSGLSALAKLGLSYGINKSGIADEQIPPTGYQGGVPSYTAVRERVPTTYDPNRRPGSMGQRYFSDMTYATGPEKRPEITPEQARALATKQASGLAALNARGQNRPASPPVQPEFRGASSVIEDVPVPDINALTEGMYAGGIAGLNRGRYLNGSTDGMADRIPANIDGRQEAALSHGEFVIPADVVSHLGNGNSDAGAKTLESMMTDVRKSRTGNPKQGKQIDPNKFLPAR
jgi:hypothetical protein|tara:strand:- start:1917 stop:2684 length:768 start_codon:yes stop_codon:yes gene_type:complete